MSNVVVYLVLAFILFDIVIVVWIILNRRKKNGFHSANLQYLLQNWSRIEAIVKVDPKHAVLDADKLLDFALRKKGFEGTVGDKLKKAAVFFSDKNGIWTAHKLRNRIAHEIFELNVDEAKSALRSFKRALIDLGVKFVLVIIFSYNLDTFLI